VEETVHSDNEQEIALRLWWAILRAKMAVGAEARQLLARWDLTGAQWAVLRVLAEASPQGLMLSEISESLLVSGGNVTGIVDRLEEAGYVQRSAHPEDRRAILAALTERGRAAHKEIAPIHGERISEMFSVISAEEQRRTIATLTRIAGHVRDLSAENGAGTSDDKRGR
jgi:DNA-binding MarR family transcriptional regulator